MSRKLTSRQAAFVEQYIIDLNQTQAAIRAGYSARSARACAARLMTFANVAAAIAEAMAKRAQTTRITQERVLSELEALAFSNHSHYHVDAEGRLVLAPGAPANAHAAISSVKHRIITSPDGDVTREVEIRLWDKPGPLKLAGRHVDAKGFWDRTELSGPGGAPIAMTVEQAQAAIAEIEAKAKGLLAAKVGDDAGSK